MQKMTVAEAAKELSMTVLTVQVLMKEDRLPIGYAVKNPGSTRYHFIIFRELVDGYKKRIEEGVM